MKRTIVKYLIECVLIFVSVIAAFLIDNLQDRNRQKGQELDLLRDVTTDLIKDTTLLRQRIDGGVALSEELTRVIAILERGDGNDTIDDYSLVYSTGISLNKTTYEGIKNTGGFKFVTDKRLVSELSDYYDNREEWLSGLSSEIGRLEIEIDAYLRATVRLIDNPTKGSVGSAVSYHIDPASLSGMRGDRRLINLCYEKRAVVERLVFLMDSLRTTSKQLNEKCATYLRNEG